MRITFAFLFVFSTLILVLRSEEKLIRQSRIRILNCFVAIEPNFAAIGLAWLNRPPPRRNDEAGQSNASNDQAMSRRRISISTCRNLFEIDGTIEDRTRATYIVLHGTHVMNHLLALIQPMLMIH